MKNGMILGLWLLLGCTMVSAVDSTLVVPPGVADDDEFIVEFVQSAKTNKVKFKSGVLKLYPDPSKWQIVVRLLCAGVFGVMSIVSFASRDDAGVPCAIMLGGLAAWIASLAVSDIQLASSEQPYVVLNNGGIKRLGKAKVAWDDLVHLEHEKIVVYNRWGTVVDETRVLHFQNKFRTVLLSISNIALPIPFDNFVALVEHYWNCNTDRVVTKT